MQYSCVADHSVFRHSTDRRGRSGWVDGQAVNNAGLQLKKLMTWVQRKAGQKTQLHQSNGWIPHSRQQLVSAIYVTLKDFVFLLLQPCSWFQAVCDVLSCQCHSLGCYEMNRCACEGESRSQVGLRETAIKQKADAHCTTLVSPFK